MEDRPELRASESDRLELLSVRLVDEHAELTRAIHGLAARLGIQLGWHYILDLVWIMTRLPHVERVRVLDAGAGGGLLQWFLAERGACVLSVDRLDRSQPPAWLRQRYSMRGLCEDDLRPYGLKGAWQSPTSAPLALRLVRVARRAARMAVGRFAAKAPGTVIVHQSDLIALDDVETESIDVVVSVSALEHNPRAEIGAVVAELLRVLKPGGRILATLAAASHEDRFHEPSQGWCLTERSLRQAFRLAPEAPSNFTAHDRLFAELRACSELRDNLAPFYVLSGENGMPWGIWDPLYQPVGVVKVK